MKELIEEAENLYKQIDKAQVHLINARLQKDEEGKKSAISEIETAMCNAMQLLKCFIDRKDNIVDLNEVFHDNNAIPDKNRKIIAIKSIGNSFIGYCSVDGIMYRASIGSLTSETSFWDRISKWAYLDDLLPKGGEK